MHVHMYMYVRNTCTHSVCVYIYIESTDSYTGPFGDFGTLDLVDKAKGLSQLVATIRARVPTIASSTATEAAQPPRRQDSVMGMKLTVLSTWTSKYVA